MRSIICVVALTVLASSIAGAQFVQQGDKLVVAGNAGAAGVGYVAVSADGSTFIVGGPDDDGGLGAAWVFNRSDGVWRQHGDKLVGSGAAGTRARQGTSVALSADGNTAIMGGPADNDQLGAAWVFTRTGGVWTQQGPKLVGSGAGSSPGSWVRQGTAVALSADGNTAIVGGPGDGDWGASWVFIRSNGVWRQQGDKLVGSGGVGPHAGQGAAVALSADGDTAVVGAPYEDDWMGAFWVFTRSGGVWAQQGDKLVPAGMIGGNSPYDWDLSLAISADGDTVVAGRPVDDDLNGAAWVFTRSDGVWTQQGDKLVGSGAAGSRPSQGTSVSVSGDGDIALVGGACDDDCVGATWVFVRSDGVWEQQGEKVVAEGAAGAAQQGWVALSADGGTAVVGGPGDSNGMGAAWVFTRSGGTLWVPVVAHTAGIGQSDWRSDVGLLNVGSDTADVRLTLHGAAGAVTGSTYVPSGAQSVLVDVVAQLGATGQGSLEIVSEQPLRVTSRTYNQVSADAICNPSGTMGQSYPALAASDGLSESQAAWLPHLAEDTMFRTNIGLVNTGSAAAEATVELYDGSGTLLASYAVALAPGEWKQETQPFVTRAAGAVLQNGYAKVTVTAGAGVAALASVVDNITNDPTTIAMQRQD